MLSQVTHAPPSLPPAIQSRTEIAHLPFLGGGVSATAYVAALEACSCHDFGQQLHGHLLKNGYQCREIVQTKLLQMYGKYGRLDEMAQVFNKIPAKNPYTYTAIINVLLDKGMFEEAFGYFKRLMIEGVGLDFFVLAVALKICGCHGGVELGRQLHGVAIKAGAVLHIYVENALIDMYGKCGILNAAKKVFGNMLERDSVSWNLMVMACAGNGKMFEGLKFLEEGDWEANLATWSALVSGFVERGYDKEAVVMLGKMGVRGIEPNAQTLAVVLAACGRLREVRLGKEIYGYIVRRGYRSRSYVVNGLIDLYRRCGDMETGFEVFSKFSGRDEVSYNTMIAGYCDNREVQKAKALFDMMEGEGVSKDLITWNSMISGYIDNFMFNNAVRMLTEIMKEETIKPDSFTLGSALGACADTGSLQLGKAIHSYCIVRGLESNLFVGGALVDMYCQCRDLEAAQKTLHRLPERDIVIWNAFISGYASCNKFENIQHIMQEMRDDGVEPNVYTWNGVIAGCVENGQHELALQLFSKMQASNLRQDIYTVGIVLPACSRLATVERGKQVHGYAIRGGYDSDEYITAALIDMYAKCGMIKYAKQVHDSTKNHNLVTQNAMLNAYAINGFGEDGIAFYREKMTHGFKPDSVTFLAVLSSCVHVGSVEAGQEFFDMMGSCGVIPTLKHYTCMVDLMSRAGRLDQAYKMAEEMPMDPDSVIWGALLSGCIIHGVVNLGELAVRKLIELEPENSGNYVMLANLYASTGKWREVGKLRQQMKDEQLHKNPGCSWIEDKDETHVFMACDRSHKRAKEIYDILDNLTAQMRLEQM